jgi:hypothetical protein
MTFSEIIKAAKALGIKLTAAEFETDLYQAWEDRVALAKSYFDRDEMAKCQEMVAEANRYAI